MRRRLAVLVSATMAMMLLAFVVPLAVQIRALAADHAVDAATTEAKQISAVVAISAPAALPGSVRQLIESAGHPATVFLPSGAELGSRAPRTAAVRLAQRGRSITVGDGSGREILVAVQSEGGTVVIRCFVSDAELSHGVTQAWLILAAFALILLLLGVTIADRLLTTVTRPIRELAGVSLRLASGDLDARAVGAGPSEVREVARGLNHLAERIRDLVWQERESVADLSHRLRTPLTALRLEAEALDESGSGGRLTAQVQALEHAVTALIENARTRRSGEGGSCDAAEVVRERVTFWSVLAEDQGRIMDVRLAPPPVLVGVGAGELAACLDALLGNVFAHTPEGSRFAVLLWARAGGGGRVCVADTGPGFGLMDPVRRGASGGGSTGLGLDIARQAAEASGGSLTAGTGPEGGGQVIIELGPAPLAAAAKQPAAAEPAAKQPAAGEPAAREPAAGAAPAGQRPAGQPMAGADQPS
jgi:signal transduction histidine kinase